MNASFDAVEIDEIENGYLVYSAYPNLAYKDKPRYFKTIEEVNTFLKEEVFK